MESGHAAAGRRSAIPASEAPARYRPGRSPGAIRKRLSSAARNFARTTPEFATRELHFHYQEHRRTERPVNRADPPLQSHGRNHRMRASSALSAKYLHRRADYARSIARLVHWLDLRDRRAGKL